MSEPRLSMDLDTFLDNAEQQQEPADLLGLNIPMTDDGENMIPADSVRSIVGNLNAQMSTLQQRLEEARQIAEESSARNLNLETVVKTDDVVTTNVSIGEREIKTTLEQPFTLPFEIGNGREDELLNTRGIPIVTHTSITMSTCGRPVYTQTPTTTTVFTTTPPPMIRFPALPTQQNTTSLTQSQFDILQQQMSVLTQTVSLLTILIDRSHKPRIVEPKPYSYESEQDLNKFFAYFEEYCSSKYHNRPDQWIRLLEKYLSGKFLRLYNVITKTVTQYSLVKEQLIKWYNHEEKRKNENRLRAYHSARRNKGEDINMFALKLEQLACLAFPGVNMREHESLRTAFILSLPVAVQSKLREFIIQNEMGTQKKVPWEKLVLLADSYERERNQYGSQTQDMFSYSEPNYKNERELPPKQKDIEVIQIDNSTPQVTWSEMLKRAPKNVRREDSPQRGKSNNRQQALQKSNQQPRMTSPKKSKMISDSYCTYCGNKGHSFNECYKNLGICSYCKIKGHIRNECYYIKNNKSLSPRKFTLNCPFCEGSHLGINCTSKGNTSNRRVPYQNSGNTSNSENPSRSDTHQPFEPSPLPQRNPEKRTRTFENSSQQGQTTWNNQGAKPRTNYIEDCSMCGYSHYEGDCAGDSENCHTPQH